MSVINDVKQRVDIVEVISDYVPLQKAGRNFKALCPFHSEKNPSFFVFPDQQTWHCFGACNTGGDVFAFIMKKEGVDFGRALPLLARRAGIVLSEPTEAEKAKGKETERLFEINELVSEYYHHLLLSTTAGERAKSYLNSRGISLETIRKFRLGFSPDDWDAIKKFLINKGYEQKALVDIGLIIEKEDGGSYDRFRNRLMFPIRDTKGRVSGFGARVLDDSQPKYTNSPQTLLFDKGSNFYGIDKAKDIIRKEDLAIIVEGYMDVLAAHQNGWQNVVASMGIALTEKQVNILKRLTKNITLALDADIAGEEATLRSGEILARSLWSGLVRCEGILDAEIKAIPLPSGKDPAEVIIETPKLWQGMVTQALPILEFALEAVVSKVDFNKAEDKSLAIQKLLPLLYEVKDPIRQAQYVQKMAHMLKLDSPTLMAALKKMRVTKRKQLLEVNHSRLFRQLASSPIEEICLALLFQHPEYCDVVQELTPEFFVYTENRELFNKWQQSQSISELKEKLDTNLLEHLNYLLNKTFPPEAQKADRQRELTDCVLRLQERHSRSLEAKKEAILNLERETRGIDAELAKLEQQGIASSQRIREILIKQSKAGKTR